MSRELEIFIDGACKGNPGPGGIGYVVYKDGKKIKEFFQGIGQTTNNIAEYTAFIYALQQALILKADKVLIKTDSELLYNQMRGNYKIKNPQLKTFYDQAQHMIGGFKSFSIKHIPREKNKEADKLASEVFSKGQVDLVTLLF